MFWVVLWGFGSLKNLENKIPVLRGSSLRFRTRRPFQPLPMNGSGVNCVEGVLYLAFDVLCTMDVLMYSLESAGRCLDSKRTGGLKFCICLRPVGLGAGFPAPRSALVRLIFDFSLGEIMVNLGMLLYCQK